MYHGQSIRTKPRWVVLGLLGYALLLLGCGPASTTEVVTETTISQSPPAPDLMIQSFSITEPSWFLGTFDSIAEVVVKNQGDQAATGFIVVLVGTNREGQLVPLNFSYDLQMANGLDPGEAVTLRGSAGLGWHGHFDTCCEDDGYDAACCVMRDSSSMSLTAIVDFCEEEDALETCAVIESDESNNASQSVEVEKPQ